MTFTWVILCIALFFFPINWITFFTMNLFMLAKIIYHMLSRAYWVARQLDSAWGQKGIGKVLWEAHHPRWVHQNNGRGSCILLLLEIINQVFQMSPVQNKRLRLHMTAQNTQESWWCSLGEEPAWFCDKSNVKFLPQFNYIYMLQFCVW